MASDDATLDEGQAHRLVVFTLGDEEFGVPITLVQEIIRYSPPRPVPGSPMHVEGVINLRGRIIPVVDLRQRFGVAGARPDEAKIVIVEMPDLTVGVVVDEVREVLTLSADVCEEPPPGTSDADFVEAVGKLDGRLVVILDMLRLLGEQPLAA
ncbi:chemotaxis protein CheW [Miltoncostaea marina]|uniref:chemotaxis protein CheW n=1 Tax=Miltoncostaea marina TaxID=2843215 RepID=UPI001C3DB76C|nr:chemotaxis protein CheW [Miltoncostaea marina]